MAGGGKGPVGGGTAEYGRTGGPTAGVRTDRRAEEQQGHERPALDEHRAGSLPRPGPATTPTRPCRPALRMTAERTGPPARNTAPRPRVAPFPSPPPWPAPFAPDPPQCPLPLPYLG